MRTSTMPRILPKKARTARSDLGRNCALFEEGRHAIYRLNRAMDYPGTDALYRASLSHLLDLNGSINSSAGGPLPTSEVRSIASSIAKWTAKTTPPKASLPINSELDARAARNRVQRVEESFVRMSISSYRRGPMPRQTGANRNGWSVRELAEKPVRPLVLSLTGPRSHAKSILPAPMKNASA